MSAAKLPPELRNNLLRPLVSHQEEVVEMIDSHTKLAVREALERLSDQLIRRHREYPADVIRAMIEEYK